MSQVLVIGAGVAGAAAAWAAKTNGADVVVVADRAGASEFTSGACDFWHWEELGATSRALPHGLLQFWRAANLGELPDQGSLVVTRQGFIRPARGVLTGVLDLRRVAGREIGVPDLERPDWDGIGLCKALARFPEVKELGIRFQPVRLPVLRERFEERCGGADLAAAHDEGARVDWLAEKLSRHGVGGWLLGPWLGLQRPATPAIEAQLGIPVGETLSDVGDAAGSRLARALERFLEALGVERMAGRVAEVRRSGRRWGIDLAEGSQVAKLSADRLIVACGGLASGGLLVKRSLKGQAGGARLSLGFGNEGFPLSLDGADLDATSSLHGLDFEHLGRGLLERAGLAAIARSDSEDVPTRIKELPGLGAALAPPAFAAGDVLAGVERTLLAAAFSGVCAGFAASK
ncbi:MAG: FAD-dependent oxidoreductase [Myxococcales bacterium]|nr:FAD-dependent oxidoreductase [Myxococcales bacterium]MCB9609226.1 FAD-dependent oxidoreductase [Polyangiaceae bacterium]